MMQVIVMRNSDGDQNKEMGAELFFSHKAALYERTTERGTY